MPRDATARPAGQRRYSMADHGHSESGGVMVGNHVFKPGRVSLWTPSFTGGQTTIRIFPVRNPDRPNEWEPYRTSANGVDGIGDWIRLYSCVKSMGEPGVTYIIRDRADRSLDEQMSPAWILFRAIQACVKRQQDPGWGGFLMGGQGRGAQLPKPTEMYFVQCAIVMHGGKPKNPPIGLKDDDELVVMQLPKSAGNALIDLLNEVKTDYQGPPEDYEQRMAYGDPVSLQHGRWVTFYNLERGDPRQPSVYNAGAGTQPRQLGQVVAGNFGQQQDSQEKGYGCFIEDSFYGMGANMTALEGLVSRKTQHWDDILQFLTYEEQAALLADKFPVPMIMYAWREHPEWIPENVQRAFVNSHNVAMGGHGIPPGAPVGAYPGGLPAGAAPQPGPGGMWVPAGAAPPNGMPADYSNQPAPAATPGYPPGQPQQQFAGFGPAGFAAAPVTEAPTTATQPAAWAGGMTNTAAPPAEQQQQQQQQQPPQQQQPQQLQQPPQQQPYAGGIPVGGPAATFPPAAGQPAPVNYFPPAGQPQQPPQQPQQFQQPQQGQQPQPAPTNGTGADVARDALTRARALQGR